MASLYLPDTNILIAAMKGHPEVRKRLEAEQISALRLSAIVLGELEFGADWKLRLDDATLLGLQQWLGADCVKVQYKRFHAPIPQRKFAAAGGGSYDDE